MNTECVITVEYIISTVVCFANNKILVLITGYYYYYFDIYRLGSVGQYSIDCGLINNRENFLTECLTRYKTTNRRTECSATNFFPYSKIYICATRFKFEKVLRAVSKIKNGISN